MALMTEASPRVALIHATPLAMAPIASAFAQLWPQARCMNLLDDTLSLDRAAAGQLTPQMVQRFVDLARYAKGTGCQGILFTCSAFGPAIEAAARAAGLPTLKPNEAMFEQALAAAPAGRLGLVATFEASLAPMSQELLALAARQGRLVDLQTVFVPEAMQDLAEARGALHDEKIAAGARTLQGCDVIMLAQFSMAQARPAVQQAVACSVLSSPDCAVIALKERMNHD
jgi:hypothetical protein